MEGKKGLSNLVRDKYLIVILALVLMATMIVGYNLFFKVTEYEFDRETGIIINYNYTDNKDVVIPAEIRGVAVTSIGYKAFKDSDLTSVTIPVSVTKIGDGAFNSNYNLTSIIIEGDRTRFNSEWSSIGFSYELMPEIINYNGMYFDTINGKIVKYIGSKSNIVVPTEIEGVTVTSIGSGAFYNKNLISVTIPSSVTSIGNIAFHSNKLFNITIEGDENRFNDLWEDICFPNSLKP